MPSTFRLALASLIVVGGSQAPSWADGSETDRLAQSPAEMLELVASMAVLPARTPSNASVSEKFRVQLLPVTADPINKGAVIVSSASSLSAPYTIRLVRYPSSSALIIQFEGRHDIRDGVSRGATILCVNHATLSDRLIAQGWVHDAHSLAPNMPVADWYRANHADLRLGYDRRSGCVVDVNLSEQRGDAS